MFLILLGIMTAKVRPTKNWCSRARLQPMRKSTLILSKSREMFLSTRLGTPAIKSSYISLLLWATNLTQCTDLRNPFDTISSTMEFELTNHISRKRRIIWNTFICHTCPYSISKQIHFCCNSLIKEPICIFVHRRLINKQVKTANERQGKGAIMPRTPPFYCFVQTY